MLIKLLIRSNPILDHLGVAEEPAFLIHQFLDQALIASCHFVLGSMVLQQVLPQELLDIIVSKTLEPWPAHIGSLYDVALSSRFRNSFLLVNKSCRQVILHDLSDTLWLEFEWHGYNPGKSATMVDELHPLPNVSPENRGSCPRIRPYIKVVITEFSHPSELSTTFVAPFIYQEFAGLMRKCHRSGYGPCVSTGNLTIKTSKYVEEVLLPLQQLVFPTVPILGTTAPAILENDTSPLHEPRDFGFLTKAKSWYREYQRLKSLGYTAEADMFVLHINLRLPLIIKNLVRRSWCESMTWLLESPSNDTFESYQPQLTKLMKIFLEFSILTNAILGRLLSTDSTWLMRQQTFNQTVTRVSRHERFIGLSNLDLARWYHATGMLESLHNASGKILFATEYRHASIRNFLAAAVAMFPQNEEWRRDLEENSQRFYEQACVQAKLDYPPKKYTYSDLRSVQIDWIYSSHILASEDASFRHDSHNDPPDYAFEKLFTFQELAAQQVKELERELGIENGDWKMG